MTKSKRARNRVKTYTEAVQDNGGTVFVTRFPRGLPIPKIMTVLRNRGPVGSVSFR
jgi:hypothetical protein